MASFVSIKQFNELVKRVEDLEAQVRALESYGEPETEDYGEPETEAVAEIPSIEEALEEPEPADPMNDLFGHKIADLLKENGYEAPFQVKVAVQDGVDLTEIPGIGAATFRVIKEMLELG